MVSNFLFPCPILRTRPYHNWPCDPKTSYPLIYSPLLNLRRPFTRTCVPRALGHPSAPGRPANLAPERSGNWAGSPEKSVNHSLVRQRGRHTEGQWRWMASLHLSPCGITPRSSFYREFAFQPGLCKQPSLYRVFLAAPILCAGNNPINCIIAVERRPGNSCPKVQ